MTAVISDDVEAAGEAIRAGKLVAFPTETVYGLGGDATNAQAVAAIFAAKGRPRFNPLIVHLADIEDAARLVRFNAHAARLADALWPGPLTIVAPRVRDCPVAELASAGLDTLAVRVPASPLARRFIAAAGRPVAAPSANVSGRLSPTRAEHVKADLGERIAMILTGEACRVGVESTIIACLGERPVVLRPGAVTAAEAGDVLGLGEALETAATSSSAPTAPGQLASHYAPRARLRLNAGEVRGGEALLAFGKLSPGFGGPVVNLSPAGDLVEAAANLYAGLHQLDATGLETIAVMPIPDEGLGQAINDRLRRAAAPRP